MTSTYFLVQKVSDESKKRPAGDVFWPGASRKIPGLSKRGTRSLSISRFCRSNLLEPEGCCWGVAVEGNGGTFYLLLGPAKAWTQRGRQTGNIQAGPRHARYRHDLEAGIN